MKKTLTVFLSVLVAACASNTPHDKESSDRPSIDGEPVIVYMLNKDESVGLTVGELLQKMNDDSLMFAIELGPEPRHEQVAHLVVEFLEKTHYEQVLVNDKLSSLVLDRYLSALDQNRIYLRADDIESFAIYRDKIDDGLKAESLHPVFGIFEVYQSRARERFIFALSQLEIEPNFSISEWYLFDRKDQPWLQTNAELDEQWRKRVKYDILNLKMVGNDWTEIQVILHRRYMHILERVDKVRREEVFSTFMNALTNTVDPHSSYLSPRLHDGDQTWLNHDQVGIGMSLQTDNNFLTVVKIDPGSPAAIDGRLHVGDRITAVAEGVNGAFVDVVGWGLDEAIELIRGPVDTELRLRVLPSGTWPGSREEVIGLTRNRADPMISGAKSDIVKVPRDGKDWSIGVITVPSFYRDLRTLNSGETNSGSTTKDVDRLIKDLENHGIDGLIVDVRNNGGGYLSEATALSGLFIDNGPIVQLHSGGDRISRLDDPDPVSRVAFDGPLAVLVNRNSASASEIFAAAIKDYARGVIVGQRTFGMGTVQNTYLLDEYVQKTSAEGLGQLTLTVGKFYRVVGDSPQLRGVEPDIDLPSLIDADLIGEVVRETALPWDAVPATEYDAGEPLTKTISVLTANHISRIKDDPDYKYQVEEFRDAGRVRARKNAPLNIDDRYAERAADTKRRLDRENMRRAALQIEPVEALDDLESQDGPDYLLELAIRIVADMAELKN